MIVHFFLTRDRVESGVREPIDGVLDFQALSERTIVGTPDEVVLPIIDPVALVNGAATVTLPTGYWRVMLRGPNRWTEPVFVFVGEGGAIDWPEVPRVDPLTLTPTTLEPEAAWWAALQEAQLGVQVMPDPDNPDLLILTMNEWQLDPNDPLAVLLPVGTL